nr:GntR family transcriptional regulator [Acuticoccus mangrovi]
MRERIYRDLLTRLQRSEFGEDDRLVDTDIARLYGTSRMPAREALLQLVNEGYLEGTTRGFTLPRLSIEDIRDIFEVRKLLEPRAAGQAALSLDGAALRALRGALDEAGRAARAGDLQAMIAANITFRNTWLGHVRNARLASTIARFVDHVQTVRLETLKRPATQRVVAEGLAEIFAAFEARDALSASDRMAAFLGAAEAAFFSIRAGHQHDGALR